MLSKPIKLVKDTITHQEIDQLCDWLKTYPQLTKGKLTEEFEQLWSDWLGVKYSVFVNSGSSANLAMLYALKVANRLKNNKIILPCVSWVTTVSPAIQFGMEPILCDTDKDGLGLDVEYFEKLCKEHNPACVMLVHVLGVPNKLNEILDICKKYDVILLEDSCESVGTLYNSKQTGTFGIMSSFSTYFGHHFSTIEGGFVCTNDFELYEILKSIRSHGWSRDLSVETKEKLQKENNIDNFRNFYTFYYPGFNLRATDVQAFLGINQLKTLNTKNQKRYNNLVLYDSLIKNNYWKLKYEGFVSNFAYPIIHPNKNKIAQNLQNNNIECRPLICGSMSRQPFFYKQYGLKQYPFSDVVHDYGLYLPNNPDMTEEDIVYISNIVNETINKDTNE
jgi:CDP-6-deoxy-D-xylo-4-hexulose-3-dehydrase